MQHPSLAQVDRAREFSDAAIIDSIYADSSAAESFSIRELVDLVGIESMEDDDDLFELMTAQTTDGLIQIQARLKKQWRQRAQRELDAMETEA